MIGDTTSASGPCMPESLRLSGEGSGSPGSLPTEGDN